VPSTVASRPARSRDSALRFSTRALVAFSEYSFDGASTRSIAELAGVTQPLLNYHFAGQGRTCGERRSTICLTVPHFDAAVGFPVCAASNDRHHREADGGGTSSSSPQQPAAAPDHHAGEQTRGASPRLAGRDARTAALRQRGRDVRTSSLRAVSWSRLPPRISTTC